ncbi:class I SAM-dependent methyltransferase [Parachryseolinea silvisoli]|uniref:class I SAM-dependent methyltransferase n=1 Tax=Parachryseolinea silvisoli TaxID=2873601 RepID=UPI002265A420|nr:class I SAM-dependent methyltransferase [Parachryseolinea silvisoli]MCD9017283.1 class I SAM-dependent methyltransferase [Parachryseolinea silvisoli]
MEHKDYFSGHAKVYAAFRPAYPVALYDFIFRHLPQRRRAWDCATGNGQVARHLAQHFQHVDATDISQQQLDNAYRADNITYSVAPAEKSGFADGRFDLITVAQALHWFDTHAFYQEVRRTGAPGGLLAVWGYASLRIEPFVDEIITDFYSRIVGPYWDDARRLVEERYLTIPFPFPEIPSPGFHIDVVWTLDHLAGYLESWSATQKYTRATGINPVPELCGRLRAYWSENDTKTVRFPIFLRLGEIS